MAQFRSRARKIFRWITITAMLVQLFLVCLIYYYSTSETTVPFPDDLLAGSVRVVSDLSGLHQENAEDTLLITCHTLQRSLANKAARKGFASDPQQPQILAWLPSTKSAISRIDIFEDSVKSTTTRPNLIERSFSNSLVAFSLGDYGTSAQEVRAKRPLYSAVLDLLRQVDKWLDVWVYEQTQPVCSSDHFIDVCYEVNQRAAEIRDAFLAEHSAKKHSLARLEDVFLTPELKLRALTSGAHTNEILLLEDAMSLNYLVRLAVYNLIQQDTSLACPTPFAHLAQSRSLIDSVISKALTALVTGAMQMYSSFNVLSFGGSRIRENSSSPSPLNAFVAKPPVRYLASFWPLSSTLDQGETPKLKASYRSQLAAFPNVVKKESRLVCANPKTGNVAIAYKTQNEEEIEWHLLMVVSKCPQAKNKILRFKFHGAADVTAIALTQRYFLYARSNDKFKFRISPSLPSLCGLEPGSTIKSKCPGSPILSQPHLTHSIHALETDEDTTSLVVIVSYISPWKNHDLEWFLELHVYRGQCTTARPNGLRVASNLWMHLMPRQSRTGCRFVHQNVLSVRMSGENDALQHQLFNKSKILKSHLSTTFVYDALPKIKKVVLVKTPHPSSKIEIHFFIEGDYLSTLRFLCEASFVSCSPSSLILVNALPVRSIKHFNAGIQVYTPESWDREDYVILVSSINGTTLSLFESRVGSPSYHQHIVKLDELSKDLGDLMATSQIPRAYLKTQFDLARHELMVLGKFMTQIPHPLMSDSATYLLNIFEQGDIVLIQIPFKQDEPLSSSLYLRFQGFLHHLYNFLDNHNTPLYCFAIEVVFSLIILIYTRSR